MPSKNLVRDDDVFSVSIVSKALKDVVESQFSAIRVRGEVTGLKKHTSGHVYFALKDEGAVMDAVCWRGTGKTNLLREGLEIIAFGSITTYPGRSKYQMIIKSFEPTGEGALLQLLQQRKEQLLKEGLFDARHKKNLPLFPSRIGVITSPTGAVLRDIMHRLQDRYPCHVILAPVLVQGDGASTQVATAIDFMNNLPLEIRPDVILVARGGGSLEDLFAFNEENVIRAAFSSTIPIISAIGHETDVTLLDFVADVRAPTPTAAAEIATPVLSQIKLRIQELYTRSTKNLFQHCQKQHLRLHRFESFFKDPLRPFFERQQRLDDLQERLHFSMQHRLVQFRLTLGERVLKAPFEKISLARLRYNHAAASLGKSFAYGVSDRAQHLARLSQGLEQLSYKKTLHRGFSLAQDNDGNVLSSVHHIPIHPFALHFEDGTTFVQKVSKQAAKKPSHAIKNEQGRLF